MSVFLRIGTLPLKFKTFILLLILFFIYSLNFHFFDGVLPIHEWRKTDSLSIAWNYYQGAAFLEPETNYISSWGNRNAAAEFPIIYYLVGNLWKLFGPHEWIAKLVSFTTLLSSLVLVSSVVNYFLKNQVKTLIFIGIIFSSPVLLFYADTLLPNVFSFSFVLISAYFLFNFIVRGKKWAIGFFTLFLTIAVLIKVTVLISLLTLAGGATMYYLLSEKNLFKKHTRTFLFLLGACSVTLFSTYLWYSYAINYNSQHHSTLFSTTIRPIWEVDAQRQKEIWEIIWKYQFNSLYNYWALVPTILFVLYLAIRNKVSVFFYWLIGIGFVGVVSYLILWFWVFDVHDYYLIEMLFFPILFFFIAVKYINKPVSITKYFSFSVLILVFLQAISFTQISFGRNNLITKNTFLVSQFVKGNWGYFHWYHNDHLKKLQMQKKEIQQIISEKDTVFCLSDASPNVHLYTIGRVGYSNFSFDKNQSIPVQIPSFIKKGARYMLVVGNEPVDTLLNQFTRDTVYAKNSVFLFDLKSYKN
jgi:hypothetical protein